MIPFVLAIPLTFVAVVLWFDHPLQGDANSLAFGVVSAVLVFDLPVCAWVAIQWLITGEPPDLTLEPLVPSREQRQLHRELRERPALSDAELYNKFYVESSIPEDLPGRVRKCVERWVECNVDAIHPSDCLGHLDGELDGVYLLHEVHREFGIRIPDERLQQLDGSFDSLLKCVDEIRCSDN